MSPGRTFLVFGDYVHLAAALTLDLTRQHFSHTRGVLAIIGTWIRVENDWTPCLVLLRAGEEGSPDTFPCVITYKNAWIFDETIGDPRQAARILHGFIAPLRLENDPKQIIKLHGIVVDYLDDLLRIPPYRPGEADLPVIGELTITHRETGKTSEVELRDV